MLQTNWEGGYFPLTLYFSEDYHSKPPECNFPQGFFPPKRLPICDSISPSWRFKAIFILVGIQDLLNAPNTTDPAQAEGYNILIHRRVRLQAKQYPPLV
ncbi:hypothetical protein V6Z11_D12G099400 [Gossypium hirsutum]